MQFVLFSSRYRLIHSPHGVVHGRVARSGANVTYSAANRLGAFSDKGRSREVARKPRVIARHVTGELPPSWSGVARKAVIGFSPGDPRANWPTIGWCKDGTTETNIQNVLIGKVRLCWDNLYDRIVCVFFKYLKSDYFEMIDTLYNWFLRTFSKIPKRYIMHFKH